MPFDDYKKPEKGCAEKREGKLSPDTKKPGRTELKKKKQRKKGQNRGANGEHERKQRRDLKTEK
jgi:hypothetical protein